MTEHYDDGHRPLIRRSDVVGVSRGVIILLLIISPLIVGLFIFMVVDYLSNRPGYSGYFVLAHEEPQQRNKTFIIITSTVMSCSPDNTKEGICTILASESVKKELVPKQAALGPGEKAV